MTETRRTTQAPGAYRPLVNGSPDVHTHPTPLVPTQATHCLGRDIEYQPYWSPQSGRSRDRPHHSRRGPPVREVAGQATPLTAGPLGFRLEGRKTEVFRVKGRVGAEPREQHSLWQVVEPCRLPGAPGPFPPASLAST